MRRLAIAVFLLLFSAAACAQQAYVPLEQRFTPEQRHAAGLDTLTPAQLQALNRLLRDEAPHADAVQAEARTGEGVPVQAGANARAGTDASAGDEPRAGANLIGLGEGPIKTRLMGRVSSWEPGTEFALENGQRWKVLKGSATLRKPLEAPDVVLVPGVAGRWFLQIDENMPKARVYRID